MTGPRLAAAAMVVIVMLVGTPLWAAEETQDLEKRLDAETREAVSAIVDQAKKDGLPTRPLIAKALEGATKGASGERIVRAVRAYADAFRKAVTALGSQSSEAEIVAAAGALQGGVPADTLVRLRSARPHDSLVVPLVVLSDLIARGVPAQVASSAVLAPTRAGARDPDLLSIREQVERDIRAGVAPGSAASLHSRTWVSARTRPVPPEAKPVPSMPTQRKSAP